MSLVRGFISEHPGSSFPPRLLSIVFPKACRWSVLVERMCRPKCAPPKMPSMIWKRWNGLHWGTPSMRLPHGLTGALSVVVGLKIIGDSLTGNVHQYDNSWSFTNGSWLNAMPFSMLTYALLAFLNAMGGRQLSNKAPKDTRAVFRLCGMFQMCLCYFIVRFLPHFSVAWGSVLGRQGPVAANCLSRLLWMVDLALTVLTLFTGMTLTIEGIHVAWSRSKAVATAIAFCSIGIFLFAVYPVQLAWNGQEWYECVQSRYSHQAAGMVGYIYVPATVTFSLILFEATLLLRGILSYTQFGLATLGVVAVCLLGTVLSQEVHIPYVSTQRIYLPCHEPIAGSMEKVIVDALDFSLYARAILTALFGIHFHEHHK